MVVFSRPQKSSFTPMSEITANPPLRSKLISGALTLLAGSGLVGVTNFIYNIVTARLLGATGFAHATAVIGRAE